MSVNLDKSTSTPQSGYTPCARRDCMDTTVSSDMSKPELCSECADAGCEAWPVFPRPDCVSGYCSTAARHECQRDDAYGEW